MIGLAVMVAVAPAAVQAGTIAAAMADSAAGWNSGDLNRFAAIYADDAVFVGSKGLLRGKPAITAHFASSFGGGGNSRGTLSFTALEDRAIDATHRLYVARWQLAGDKPASGFTTLLFERRGGRWLIVSDHSS